MTKRNKKGNGDNVGSGVKNNDASSKMAKLRSQDSQDYSCFKTVLFYCLLIVFLPVITFCLMKGFVLDRFFRMSEMKVNITSAVGAVVSLHLALGLYIYRAYYGSPGSGSKKLD